ncbi:MAG: hypothetical protein OEW35_09655 [Gammaproteobacteria bacterium]|nr:hypothetical protein [Gammaproteobacteria bacterium]MDH4253629.1 hypothetical protein [Gammaproteobacteria bacterium]MDH5311473.1 hypothetical protein [Gammaproteobacteria bacterium]
MDTDALLQNWGPLIGAVLLALVAVSVIVTLLGRSARGQLRQRARELSRRRSEFEVSRNKLRRAERKLAALQERAARVPPRQLHETGEAVEDARALVAIAHDRVLVAANLLRRVICEEFPPARHDSLRARYLPDDNPDKRPFSY